jgi:hypothetical protein
LATEALERHDEAVKAVEAKLPVAQARMILVAGFVPRLARALLEREQRERELRKLLWRIFDEAKTDWDSNAEYYWIHRDLRFAAREAGVELPDGDLRITRSEARSKNAHES